jgi:hypothetical protein
VVLWSTIEVLIAHACFCIPAFRACLRRKKSAAGSVADRNTESRNTVRAPGRGVGGGGEWFDSFSSNPNSPLSGVRLQEPVFPSLAAAVGGNSRQDNTWMLVPPKEDSDGDEGSEDSEDIEDCRDRDISLGSDAV